MDVKVGCGPLLSYLLRAIAGTEEAVTVLPAALECLQVRRGVVLEQVLLKVLHHTKDQRAAVPLLTHMNTH